MECPLRTCRLFFDFGTERAQPCLYARSKPSYAYYECFCRRCDVWSRRLREHAGSLDGCRSSLPTGRRSVHHARAARRHRCGSAAPLPLLRGGRWKSSALWNCRRGEGFGWSGVAMVHSKQEWPDWYPTKEILERHPELKAGLKELPGGQAAGGPDTTGARALYLWQGKKDTLYRIHGTNEPWKIGSNVSSGCIRMINRLIVSTIVWGSAPRWSCWHRTYVDSYRPKVCARRLQSHQPH